MLSFFNHKLPSIYRWACPTHNYNYRKNYWLIIGKSPSVHAECFEWDEEWEF